MIPRLSGSVPTSWKIWAISVCHWHTREAATRGRESGNEYLPLSSKIKHEKKGKKSCRKWKASCSLFIPKINCILYFRASVFVYLSPQVCSGGSFPFGWIKLSLTTEDEGSTKIKIAKQIWKTGSSIHNWMGGDDDDDGDRQPFQCFIKYATSNIIEHIIIAKGRAPDGGKCLVWILQKCDKPSFTGWRFQLANKILVCFYVSQIMEQKG